MKSLRLLFAALAAVLLSASVFAADPTGTWKWPQPGRGDRPGFDQILKLDLKDGKLTGTILGFEGPMGKVPDAAIGDPTFKDDALTFTVTREFNGNKMVSKYEGKLTADTITGSVERPNRDGGTQKRDWLATRVK